MVGAHDPGIPVANGQYTGGPFGWLHPFAILTGIGLVSGYALLGAGWLVLKSEGELRDWAHRRIRWLTVTRVWRPVCGLCRCTFDYSVLARSNLPRQALGPRVPRASRCSRWLGSCWERARTAINCRSP